MNLYKHIPFKCIVKLYRPINPFSKEYIDIHWENAVFFFLEQKGYCIPFTKRYDPSLIIQSSDRQWQVPNILMSFKLKIQHVIIYVLPEDPM